MMESSTWIHTDSYPWRQFHRLQNSSRQQKCKT